MSLLITKSNKLNHLQNKLLGISYLQIKIMKIWNSKRYYHVFKTCMRQKTTPKRYQKLEFQTPKRYDGHPYHFTIKEPPPPQAKH